MQPIASAVPVRFILTAGNAGNHNSAIPLLTGLSARHVITDKAYDSHSILDCIEAGWAQPVIPQRKGMPRWRAFDAAIYTLRNRIERTTGGLKQLRSIATRYDPIP